MAVTNKYTGDNMFLEFNGVEIHNGAGSGEMLLTSFEWTEEGTTVDVTAAGETAQRNLGTKRSLTGSFTIYRKAGGDAAGSALYAHAQGTLDFGPRGTVSGYERQTFEAIITSVSNPVQHDSAVAQTINFVRHGDWINYSEKNVGSNW